MTPSENDCVSPKSFVHNRCASASSSTLPETSGLKCEQFNAGIALAGGPGCTTGCTGDTGGTGSTACGPTSSGCAVATTDSGYGGLGGKGGNGGPPLTILVHYY